MPGLRNNETSNVHQRRSGPPTRRRGRGEQLTRVTPCLPHQAYPSTPSTGEAWRWRKEREGGQRGQRGEEAENGSESSSRNEVRGAERE